MDGTSGGWPASLRPWPATGAHAKLDDIHPWRILPARGERSRDAAITDGYSVTRAHPAMPRNRFSPEASAGRVRPPVART